MELIERADLLIAGGHSESARGMLQHALEVDPLNVEAKRMLAGVAVGAVRTRRENTSNLPEQAQFAAAEREDMGVITRRERAIGNDRIAVALTQRMAELKSAPLGVLVRNEDDRYASSSDVPIDPVFARPPEPKPAQAPVRYSPVGIIVWFIIGNLLGSIALYGWLFIPLLPNLHKMLQWTPSTEFGACVGLGLVTALLLGRSRPVHELTDL